MNIPENTAGKFCETLTPAACDALAGACLTAYLTVLQIERDGLAPGSVDWRFLLDEPHNALAQAGHPAGSEPRFTIQPA
jgi:hypothetical protein